MFACFSNRLTSSITGDVTTRFQRDYFTNRRETKSLDARQVDWTRITREKRRLPAPSLSGFPSCQNGRSQRCLSGVDWLWPDAVIIAAAADDDDDDDDDDDYDDDIRRRQIVGSATRWCWYNQTACHVVRITNTFSTSDHRCR